MKNTKKIITGVTLLTSLSIFAGTIAVNSSNKTTNTTTGTGTNTATSTQCVRPTEKEREEFRLKMDNLRQKLEKGTATKTEMAEAAQFLGGKKDGKRGNDNCRPEKLNNENRIAPERIEELKTKVKSGKLTATEAEEVLKLIERRGNKGPKINPTN